MQKKASKIHATLAGGHGFLMPFVRIKGEGLVGFLTPLPSPVFGLLTSTFHALPISWIFDAFCTY